MMDHKFLLGPGQERVMAYWPWETYVLSLRSMLKRWSLLNEIAARPGFVMRSAPRLLDWELDFELEIEIEIDLPRATARSSHLEYLLRLVFFCFGFSILTTLMVWSCWARNSCVPDLKRTSASDFTVPVSPDKKMGY